MKIPESFFPRFHVQQAVYTHVDATAPWGMDFIAYHHVKFGIVAEGCCYIDLKNNQPPLKLEKGSCYLLTRGDAFRLRDQLTTIADDFEPLLDKLDGRVLRHGGGGEATSIMGGRFIFKNDTPPPVLDLLPALIHFKVEENELEALQATIKLLASEINASGNGAGAMIDRLTDIYFIQTLRAFLVANNSERFSWHGAVIDEQLVQALQLIHENYKRNWTIAMLAKSVGMSRAVFAARFKEKLGISPIAYLARFRLYQAQDLLNQGKMSVAQVAQQVGYDSEPAFYKAFKRQVGVSPGSYKKLDENKVLIPAD